MQRQARDRATLRSRRDRRGGLPSPPEALLAATIMRTGAARTSPTLKVRGQRRRPHRQDYVGHYVFARRLRPPLRLRSFRARHEIRFHRAGTQLVRILFSFRSPRPAPSHPSLLPSLTRRCSQPPFHADGSVWGEGRWLPVRLVPSPGPPLRLALLAERHLDGALVGAPDDLQFDGAGRRPQRGGQVVHRADRLTRGRHDQVAG